MDDKDLKSTENDTEEIEEMTEKILYTEYKKYETKESQYNDRKSSGMTLILLGILGYGFIALVLLKIVPITLYAYAYVIMFILFTAAIIYGVVTLRKCAVLLKESIEEKNTTDSILEDFLSKYNADIIDESVDNNLPEEEKYFDRAAVIRELITKEYGELDSAYAESLVDTIFEKIYK